MMYKDLEDGKFYSGGISAFKDGAEPDEPYTYDNEGSISQEYETSCDTVDK